MHSYKVSIEGVDEQFPPIEAEDAEQAAREFIVENASQYPNELSEWDLSVTGPLGDKLRFKVTGTRLTEDGSLDEFVINVLRVS